MRRRAAATLAGLAVSLTVLSGCQGGVSAGSSAASLRVIDAAADAPGVDVYTGSTGFAYNLVPGTITSYVPVLPGPNGVVLKQAGTRTQLAASEGDFGVGGQYTAVVVGSKAGLEEMLLKDQSVAAPAGEVAIRVVNANTSGGGVDVYLVPSGSTIATTVPMRTNLKFNGNTGYLNVPAGTYTLVVLAAGTVPANLAVTAYTGAAIPYASGAVRTVVLTNGVGGGVNVILGDDFDALPES